MKHCCRLYGNYDSIIGGLVSDSYINLTGGVAEMINFDDLHKSGMTEDQLFERLKNALSSGAVACCDVPVSHGRFIIVDLVDFRGTVNVEIFALGLFSRFS